MYKSEILIEQGAFGTVKRVEVAMDVPVSLLLPQLVKKFQLPPTDLFGKTLPYQLRMVASGCIISESLSLEAAGVQPGMRLLLDSAFIEQEPVTVSSHLEHGGSIKTLLADGSDFSGSASRIPPQSPVKVSAYQRPADPQLHSSETLSDVIQFSPTRLPAQSSGLQYPGTTASHRRSRRTFLVVAGTVIGVSGLGVGYAAFRSLTAQRNGVQAPMAQQKKNTSPAQKMAVKPEAVPGLTFKQHQQLVRSVAWSPNGQFLASGADDARMLVWDPKGNVLQDIKHPASVHTLSWSPDGQRLVTGANTQIAFYQALTGNRLFHARHNHVQPIAAVAWSSKGLMHVVSAGADQRAIVWDSANYQALLTYRMHHAAITAASWSSDSRTVATSSSGGVIHVWDTTNGQDLHGIYQDGHSPLRALVFAPVGSLLAAGGDDGIVRIWNGLTCMLNGAQCQDQPQRLTTTKAAVRALAWSPDARFLLVGANDGTVMLFQATHLMQPLFTLQVHTNVRSVSWSPDGQQIAVAYGNQVTLWNLRGL